MSDMSHAPEERISDDALTKLINKLRDRFGRNPTEEVLGFIYGDDHSRFLIWNTEKIKIGYACHSSKTKASPSKEPT